MKNLTSFIYLFVLLPFSIFCQTTEDFETDNTHQGSSFTSNGIDFSITGGNFAFYEFAGIGYDGSSWAITNLSPSSFTCSEGPTDTLGGLATTNGDQIHINTIWVRIARDCGVSPQTDSITIVLKSSGTIVHEEKYYYGNDNTGHSNNFWEMDLNTNGASCIPCDEILFIPESTNSYVVLDHFTWSLPTEITPSITSVVIDGGVNNQCPGTATINLTASAIHNDFDTLKWYGNSEGTGTPLGTGLTLTNQTPDSTTTYYAKINGLCGTNVSDQVTYTAKDTAAVTSITSNKNNICSVDSVELTATADLGDNGSFEWFDQANGQGNSLGTDLTITQTPGSTKKYYAYITSTCNNAQDSIEITVDPTKTVSTLTDITSDDNDICDGTQITLTANGVTLGTGATGNWYPQANGLGDAISSNTSIDTVPLATNNYYYYITGECNTVQDSIEVTVLNTDTTITNDGSTLTSAATGVDYNWLNCADNSSTGVTTQSFTPTETGDYKVEITNSTCVDTSSCQNITITSLNGQLSQLGVALFPNPTQDFINISLTDNFTATVMNANGMQVIAPTSSSQINLSDLSFGVYFIEISKNDISETFKVIKE